MNEYNILLLPLEALHHSLPSSHFDPHLPPRPRRLQVHNKLVKPVHHSTLITTLAKPLRYCISPHEQTPHAKVTNPFVWRRPFC